MALSKRYTLAILRSLVRDLADEVAPNKIQDDAIREIINKNVLGIAEQLNGASAPDYGTTQVISDAASSYAVSLISTGAGYAYATRTITTVALHALTSADIGKRIVFFDQTTDPAGKVAIAQIESITSTYAFVVTAANGVADITSPNCDYAVFSAHSTANVDLSALRIDKVIKVVDATNGLVSERKDLAFENLSNISHLTNSVFYNLFGETLFLAKGSDVSAWGTLTLYYYRIPVLVSADSDYIDLKDKYMDLLIDKCYLDVYAKGKSAPPQSVMDNVRSATAQIRGTNAEKEAKIMQQKGS